MFETKCDIQTANSRLGFLRYLFSVGVDPEGLVGGIWIGRRHHLILDTIVRCRNYVLCCVHSKNNDVQYVCFVYGTPNFQDRPGVWLVM